MALSSRLIQTFLSIIDWFLPEKIRSGNIINKYRQRVAIFFLLTQLPLCFGFGIIFQFWIPLGGMNIMAPLGGVVFICALYMSRRFNSPIIISLAGPGMTLVSISYSIYLTGGIESPIAGAMLLIPLVAGMIAGRNLVIVWSFITLITAGLLTILHYQGIELSNSMPDYLSGLFSLLSTAALIFLIIMSFMMRSWIESAARRQLELLNQNLKIEMERTEKFGQAKQDFLTTMSHEIRTPINGIIGATELIKSNPMDENQKEHFSIILNCSEMLLQIINNILDFSRLDQKKVKLDSIPFQIEKSLQNAISIVTPLINRKNIKFTSNIDPSIPKTLLGDPIRLAQVILNLLNNACKYTHQGSIHVEMNNIGQDGKTVNIKCEIKDTGIGITHENIEKIFARYSRHLDSRINNMEGTGLGLNISKKIVELMGGNIGVHSKYGNGSTFWFQIPLAISDVSLKTPFAEFKSNSNIAIFGKGEKILLVEDNPINQMVALKLLKKNNIDADLAENGKVCLDLVKRNNYKMILMDLKMPTMDGFEATIKIREDESGKDLHIPIIALTANADDDTKSRCFEIGMDGILHKPFKFGELLEAMSKVYSLK